MASASDWRSKIGAVDRYENIQRLKRDIESEDVGSTTNAHKLALAAESEAYNASESRVAYYAACSNITVQSPDNPPNVEAGLSPGSPGISIGSYQKCHHVAGGLVSEVYRSKAVALKVITETRNVEPHNPTREVKILQQLSNPSIITLSETFKDRESRLVLVFPYMPLTLSKVLESGDISHDLTRIYFRDIFSALAYLHEKGIIHRDIKPSNILLASLSGPAYLADFGTAWHPTLSLSDEPAHHKVLEVGTTCYRAPETLFGNRAYDTSLDMWATGTMLVECLRNPPKPLFESRDTSEDGNQLGLILSIFKTIGTPTKETWPEALHFSTPPFDWYQEFPGHLWEELLDGDEVARDLVRKLVCYESRLRLKAADGVLLVLHDTRRARGPYRKMQQRATHHRSSLAHRHQESHSTHATFSSNNQNGAAFPLSTPWLVLRGEKSRTAPQPQSPSQPRKALPLIQLVSTVNLSSSPHPRSPPPPPIDPEIGRPTHESMETWATENLTQTAQKHTTTSSDWADILCFYTATNGVAAPGAPTRTPVPVPNGKATPPKQEVPQSVSSTDPKVAAQQASDMRNIVRRKLTGYVGFANLPNQWHRKSVRKGFNFNVMVVGESGLGKSTLVNTLFNTSLYPPRERKGPSLDIIPKTVSIQSISADIEENGVRLRLTVVDTPGFGDFVNNDESWRPIVDNIEQRFDAYLDAENKVNRMNIVDNRVHACVYFIQPTGHALKPLDIEVMRRLHTKVNLIPVIAKADTQTDEEILLFKQRILADIKHHSIQIFEGPRYELDDEETIAENTEIMSKVPFAVVGANSEITSADGRKVRGRRYPWGVIEVDNEEHCDFVKLRQMLIRTHMEELKEHTNNALYENYRSEKLTAMGVAQDPSVFKEVNPAVKQEEERTLHEQKLAKMEAEMKMVFQQKVAEKESKLKQSEEELYARHREMKEQLERQRMELEEKKSRVESGRPLEEKGKRKGFSLR
ncbi:hypothetical protein B7494_g1708 [Chlorociboria aeruginascens]|nr:hypothetical protein B7494_g1708 [Chlorociboria aeruginascens]